MKIVTGWLAAIAGGLVVQSVYPPVLEVLPTLWVLVIGIGFALNGVWARRRLMVGYGIIATIGGLIFGIFLPPISG